MVRDEITLFTITDMSLTTGYMKFKGKLIVDLKRIISNVCISINKRMQNRGNIISTCMQRAIQKTLI